jgi:aminoglycoside 6'-N-acetyltransferase
MLERWLSTPEVVRWWGEPLEQAALLEEDLANPLMAMLIVSVGGRPFAYAQHYDVHSWPQPHFSALPPGARAVDAFIGEPDMIGRGHGSAFLGQLTRLLLQQGAPVVAIDPGADNLRARAAYRRAGFQGESVVETDEGPAVLMLSARSG